MNAKRTAPKTIDAYIAGLPTNVQKTLNRIRATIRKAAPDVEETISYQIPAFMLNGRYLIYVAAFKKHVGIYPAPAGNAEFEKEVSAYRSGKATVKLPLDKPIPFGLIGKIVKLRAKENLERAKAKAKAKRKKSSKE